METKNQRTAQIICLQKNLSAIRKIAGWTLEQLGEKIGVTKQTISNLENGKTTMTLTQYIAIRSIIDYEIQTNAENTVLPQVVEILLNRYEEYSDEEHEQISESVKTVAATASGGITGMALVVILAGLLGALSDSLPTNKHAISSKDVWMSKVLKDIRKK